VSVRLSVRPGVDLGFRTLTDGQDQVLKSRSLDGRGGRRRRMAAATWCACVCPPRGASVRPFGILLAGTQGNGYNSVSRVSLSVKGIPQCNGYHSVSGLFVRKAGSLGVMDKLLGGLWELLVRRKITQDIGITKCQGITQCNGYPLGCVRNGYHSV
jgi:hypothetical protein